MVPTKKTTRKKASKKKAPATGKVVPPRKRKKPAPLNRYERLLSAYSDLVDDFCELRQQMEQMEQSEEAREREAFLKQVDTDRKRLFARAAAGKAH